jgi:hypothetical protein
MDKMDEEALRLALTGYVKARMDVAGVNFPELGRRLREITGEDVERTVLFNRVKRGSFSAAFLVQVMEALAADAQWLQDVKKSLTRS